METANRDEGLTLAINLGPRLTRIARYVPQDAKLGDIGTDHAHLPIFLCEQGRVGSAVAVDIHKGPFESAKAAVQSHGLETKIKVRQGNGLHPLFPDEVDTLTIAGMGGNSILEILSGRPDVLEQVKQLILQPQGAEGKVRKVLLDRGWRLQDEALVEEDGKVYVVMVYSRESGWSLADVDSSEKAWLAGMRVGCVEQAVFRDRARALFWQIGPLVLEKGGDLVQRLLAERWEALNARIKEMQKGKPSMVGPKITEAKVELKAVEAMQAIAPLSF